MAMQTTIPIKCLLAAPKLSDCLPWVWQTSICSIDNWQTGSMGDRCNYQKSRLIMSRPVAWELRSIVVAHPPPSNVTIHIANGKLICLDKDIGWGIAMHIFRRRPATWSVFQILIGNDTYLGRAKNHRGDVIYTNLDKVPLLGWGFVDPILPSANVILCKLPKCCLEFWTIEDSLVCHVPLPTRLQRCPKTDSSNTTID